MKKVTQEISAAFKAGVRKSNGATMTDGKTLFLHGNAIARKDRGRLEICWCGWVTATTAERINGVLAEFGSAFRVGRKLGKPFAWAAGLKSEKDCNTWQAVSDVKI